jgi:hypothetical protein
MDDDGERVAPQPRGAAPDEPIDGGRLAGIVSIGDVVKNRLDELELEAAVMRDAYVAAASRVG